MDGRTEGRGHAKGVEPQRDEAWWRPARAPIEAGHADSLYRTVEAEIIPRLMLLHRQHVGATEIRGAASGVVPPELRHDHVVAFTEQLLRGERQALVFLEGLAARGVSLDELCLHVLAPAARRLGDLWTDDLCDFTQVTIALGRLQGLLHSLSSGMGGASHRELMLTRRALFAPLPGEQHTFGLSMVCDFFRTSGWEVWGDAPARAEAVVELVRVQAFDLVGFAIGCDRSVETLTELIRSVRRFSRNRDVRVLVGGPLLALRPQIATLVGADATGADARQAVLVAERLMAPREVGR